MRELIDMKSVMRRDSSGNIYIECRHFVDLTLAELYLIPDHEGRHDARVFVNDCIFKNVKIKGAFDVYEGIYFRNVQFTEVITRDYFSLSSLTVMEDVVISGKKKSKGLWIKPLGIKAEPVLEKYRCWFHECVNKIDVMLDLRDYHNYVEIVDYPCDKILINPALQVKIDQRYLNVDWDSHGIPFDSFFRSSAKRLKLFTCNQAIFSLPLKPEERADWIYRKELEVLYKNGILRSIDEMR